MNLTLQTKMAISFALGLFVLTLTSMLALAGNAQQNADAAGISRSLDIVNTLQTLGRALSDSEAGIRGYVISGDTRYLDNSQARWAEVESSYDALRAASASEALAQLQPLRQLLDERRAASQRVEQMRRNLNRDALKARYLGEEPLALQLQLALTLDGLEQRERQARNLRQVHLEYAGRLTRLAIATCSLLTLLLGGSAYLLLKRDIAQRKAAEQALLEANEHLRTASARAQQADKIKTAFLATMSHELRTPLNSIIGFSGILFQELAGPLNAEQKKQLGLVRENSRHLLAMVNDVLDISKVEAGQLKVLHAPFQISESLTRTVELVTPMAERKGLRLLTSIASDLGEIVSDKRRVEQVLMNLLSNAIKFTERGQVTISAESIDDYVAGQDSAPQLAMRLQVSDTGVGISPDEIPTLFQPFRQIEDHLTRPRDGTGLGLAISQRLLALMGGQISVESKLGEGSVFTVILPRHASTA